MSDGYFKVTPPVFQAVLDVLSTLPFNQVERVIIALRQSEAVKDEPDRG
jgi:hypothetical protein